MVWLTWRQHRAQVLITAGFLLAMGVFLLVHGLGNADAAAGVSRDRLAEALKERFRAVYTYLNWLPVVPLLVGMFWGAPLLARELERGTHRLAWTQSVPRRRWLAAKLGWLGLAVTVAGLALGAMISAWLTTFDGTPHADRFGDTALFGGTGVLAGAWWLFGFMLGTAAGGLLRRVVPAFAVTIAVFVAAMVLLFPARADYDEPLRWVVDAQPTGATGRYVTGSAYLSPAGEEVDVPPECAAADRTAFLDCVRDSGYRSVLYYQPAERYWQFQWTETGILALATLLLAGPVVYRVAKRPV
jgi:ABC-type transport system involved in multi-copper enzyme maturation permease subunit